MIPIGLLIPITNFARNTTRMIDPKNNKYLPSFDQIVSLQAFKECIPSLVQYSATTDFFYFYFFSKLNMLDPHKWLDRSFNGRRWLFVFIVFFISCSKKEADTNTFLGSVKPSGGNKAKGQISKGVFQENIARQIYRKANIKIWRALFFWNTRFEIRSFGLLPTK